MAGAQDAEFRRRFLRDRPARWVYLNAPVSRLMAVIDLGPATGPALVEYVQDLEQTYAIPILEVREFESLSAEEPRGHLSSWTRQGHLRLRNPARR